MASCVVGDYCPASRRRIMSVACCCVCRWLGVFVVFFVVVCLGFYSLQRDSS